jgi:crossover junction endodeoxyribonuclease RuvC
MKILGIDPGTQVMGWGVVVKQDDDVSAVGYGAIRVPAKLKAHEKLNYLFTEILKIIRKYAPDQVAVEQPFVAKNIHSAFMVGRAQAVALLAAASKKIPAFEYTPAQVKQRITNYGAGSKEQVQTMVRLLLEMKETPEPYDAADALAIALCHAQEIYLDEVIAKQGEGR